jgi:predicted KAP-like P-loop ATPase
MAEESASPGSRPPLLNDHPIESDRENSPDLLDLHERLGAPLDILRHPATRTPFTIALYCDWGTGKTSAMRWLHSQLVVWNHSPLRVNYPKITPVWFYPWKYHKREDVWRGIIAEVILATLKAGKSDDFSERAVQVAKRYGKFLGHSLLRSRVTSKPPLAYRARRRWKPPKALNSMVRPSATSTTNIKKVTEPHAPYLNDFEAQLTDWVRDTFDNTHRLVLFIDDLDRCMPDVALEVLEALKLYLNIPGLLFVAGLDRGVIDQIVTKHYEKSGVHE